MDLSKKLWSFLRFVLREPKPVPPPVPVVSQVRNWHTTVTPVYTAGDPYPRYLMNYIPYHTTSASQTLSIITKFTSD